MELFTSSTYTTLSCLLGFQLDAARISLVLLKFPFIVVLLFDPAARPHVVIVSVNFVLLKQCIAVLILRVLQNCFVTGYFVYRDWEWLLNG